MDPPSFSGLAYRNVGTFGPFACSMQSRERGVHAVRQRRQLRLQFVLSFDGSVCMQCAFPLARCRFLWGHSCLSLSLSLRVSSHWLHFSISHFLPLSLLCISFSSCMCGHRIFVASLFDAFVALCLALNLISSAAFNAPHTHACKRHTCTRKNLYVMHMHVCMYRCTAKNSFAAYMSNNHNIFSILCLLRYFAFQNKLFEDYMAYAQYFDYFILLAYAIDHETFLSVPCVSTPDLN